VRTTYDTFQAAVGLFPRQVFLNQPFEVVIILQSLIDQPQEIRFALQLPAQDADGQSVVFEAPRRSAALQLGAGEVTAVRLPAAPVPPTHPAAGLPLSVTFQVRPPRHYKILRTATGGAPPTAITVSPFKLLVLRDVNYAAAPVGAAHETVPLALDINGRSLPAAPAALEAHVEPLWTQAQYPAERSAVAERVDEARILTTTLTHHSILEPFFDRVADSFAARGLPLHPGEALAIAKMLTYTVDSGNTIDEGAAPLERLRWFQSLCQLLAADPAAAHMPPGDLVTGPLFEAALYDAVLLGFMLVRSRVKTNLGDRQERSAYANKLLGWFTGQSEPDQTYIYLPLVLGGVSVNAVVMSRDENPWDLLDAVGEAARGRVRLASRDVREVFGLLDKLIERGSDDLRRERILRR
ncbi:MAG TPA: hypothetical protein VER79_06805, partial [Candidatus Limnocylindrales bacterium]|nr:hypothetical protein [Candidatus Limnocylindrales bacterium]